MAERLSISTAYHLSTRSSGIYLSSAQMMSEWLHSNLGDGHQSRLSETCMVSQGRSLKMIELMYSRNIHILSCFIIFVLKFRLSGHCIFN